MSAYWFSMDTLVFMYSNLKKKQQNVKINNIEIILKISGSGVPQGSILGPILFSYSQILVSKWFVFIHRES